MQPEDLIGYCGANCGACLRCSSYTAFRDAARLLAELVDAHSLRYWLPQETKKFDYAEFRKGLDFFADPDSWFVCKQGCRGGGAGPPWCVRGCCREHHVDFCFDCSEFPCDKINENKRMMERAKEYHSLGRSAWLQCQVDKASQGFESHTGKRYRVFIKSADSPLVAR